MNRTALMIAYYFPPIGMGGVQRVAKLAKYLPQFGYDVKVLTVRPIRYPAYDPTLLEELPEQVTIYRSGSSDPTRISRFLPFPARAGSRVKALAREKSGWFWPDSKTGWKRPALRLARKIIAQSRPAVIFSSSPPITAHLVAMELKSNLNIPWVADFRDPWESRSAEKLYRTPELVERSNLLIREITGIADAVTAVNDSIARDLLRSAVTIMGGYDPDDFDSSGGNSETNSFTLSYMGTVGPLAPLEPFFEAVNIAAGIDSEFRERVRFRIIGANDEEQLKRMARKFGLQARLEMVGYLPHREALRKAASASISLLSVPPDFPEISTGKIFDYLALPAPILAVAPPDGEADRIIKLSRGGVCLESGQMRALAEAMLQLFRNHQSGIPWEKGDIFRFSRPEVARRFAAIFDRVASD